MSVTRCLHCGCEIPNGKNFCPLCGAPLKRRAQDPSRDKYLSFVSGMLTALVIVIVIVAIFHFRKGDSVTGTYHYQSYTGTGSPEADWKERGLTLRLYPNQHFTLRTSEEDLYISGTYQVEQDTDILGNEGKAICLTYQEDSEDTIYYSKDTIYIPHTGYTLVLSK